MRLILNIRSTDTVRETIPSPQITQTTSRYVKAHFGTLYTATSVYTPYLYVGLICRFHTLYA